MNGKQENGDQPVINIERLRYVFQNMDDAVCATRKNGELIYSNPAADRLFGLTDRKAGKLWEQIPLIPENDELIELFINGIMKKENCFRSLVDYVNSDGVRHHLHVSLTREADESGIFLIVASDLTQLMKVHSAFQRYTSPDIADYVLTAPGGAEQGGTDREVSILMSDLRGFTMTSTRMKASDLLRMLNHYFECMSAVIDRFHGTVIEFLGDGIFVVFGAPKELPDHALAAAACAVEMQNAMADVNAWNREHGFPQLEMGIGVNSGIAAVGNIGSERKMKYGCTGETVNLAGRLESYTIGGQIFVSENTVKLIPEHLVTAGEHSIMPKGARTPVRYYDVTGVGTEHCLRKPEGEKWTVPESAAEILFYEIDGKSVEMTGKKGRITRLSADGRFCLMETEHELQPLQNMLIRISGQEAYAKVMEGKKKEYRLCFTAKPDNLAGLLARN